jgi:mRNA interferase RelE/StbE
MAWSIEIRRNAERQLEQLDPQVSRRILRFLYERVAFL